MVPPESVRGATGVRPTVGAGGGGVNAFPSPAGQPPDVPVVAGAVALAVAVGELLALAVGVGELLVVGVGVGELVAVGLAVTEGTVTGVATTGATTVAVAVAVGALDGTTVGRVAAGVGDEVCFEKLVAP
jgi:hypothetical protein